MTIPPTQQSTLWLIDDDPALRLILEDNFTNAGIEVISFTNAHAAWMRLNEFATQLKAKKSQDSSTTDIHTLDASLPDIILTDIRMPMMDGLSFSDWVHKTFPDLPVIIMTAHSDLQSAVDSYQTGAFEYLPKPFDLDDAISVVNKAIKRHTPSINQHTAHLQTAKQNVHNAYHTSSNQADHQTHISQAHNNNPNNPNSVNAQENAFHSHTAQQTPQKNNARKKNIRKNKAQKNAVPNSNHKTANPSFNDFTNPSNHLINSNNTISSNNAVHAVSGNSKNLKGNESNKPTSQPNNNGIIGQSFAMQTVFRAIGRLSHTPITVLITGESGTGKELVAHALHQTSPRNTKPLIALNMAAIPQDLIESELFGHSKGAFTGATTDRQGRFEQANGGTLFLDEIGDMPFSTQTRLLRVLANGEFFRVGGQKPIKVDVRIIAATHQNLENLVKQGKFREDLFYRLNVIRLPLPALRERQEDIPALVEHFLAKSAKELNSPAKQVDADAMWIMQNYQWSGNVRQLENICRWLTVMASGDTVFVDDLPPELFYPNTNQLEQHTNHPHPHDLNDMQSSSVHKDTLADTQASHNGINQPSPHQENTSHVPHQITPNNPNWINSNNSDTGLNSNHNSTDHHEQNNLHGQHNTVNRTPNQPYQTQYAHEYQSDATKQAQTPADNVNSHLFNQANNQHWPSLLYSWAKQALENGETDLLSTALPNFERMMIEATLNHTRGHKGKAAELLGWGRNTLTRKLQQLDLEN